MASSHIFVLGLDDKNPATLRKIPNAEEYRLHGLLTRAELPDAGTPVPELLMRAERALAAADAEPDAIVAYRRRRARQPPSLRTAPQLVRRTQ
ncbi:hypothetical protein [Streptomyces halobius]|uniref:Uncharacterized protein n=1 Tax=Streptomyces halobius TaxID=2879846 RepID=A0ABY4LYH6_9ACTN|nr:hypothetical protein [Streptomyces halobius]UQA90559.1 hypothetical protein K9S39_00360 [Streptomyces halobius]